MNNAKKIVCLMSGGTDSPVACYLMIENGYIPIIVHFNLGNLDPLSDEKLKNGVLKLLEVFRSYSNQKIKVYFISHKEIFDELEKGNPNKNMCILCRRTMYRIAKEIALREKAFAIVTGESIGEKASQTPANLLVTKQAIDNFLIIQPLIALSKLEIEEIAKRIGTYEASIQESYSCPVTPRYPVTHGNLKRILEIENKIDFQWLVNQALETAKILYF